jgi:RNA 2',3'-cyclic 3'-phosphodiesterase
MPRLFAGWKLPREVGDAVGNAVAPLRERLPAASWTRPESYHITFAFLGDQPEERVRQIGDAIETSLDGIPAASTALGVPGFFPSARRPRVGWISFEPAAAVETIGVAVRGALTDLDADLARPFRAHLTLARVKQRWSRDDVEHFRSALSSLEGIPLLVDTVVLFESHLGRGGARHEVRREFMVRGSRVPG